MEMITDPDQLMMLLAAPRIVFDLDGTLYDTRDFERPALVSVSNWLRLKSGLCLDGLPQMLWSCRETDRHRPDLFDNALSRYGLPVSWGSECARRFRNYCGFELRRSMSLKKHLETLRDAKCRLSLVSNGYAELQSRKLTMLGFDDTFDIRIYCDPRTPEQLKPSPWAWTQLAAWRAGLPTVYVGDDPVDAEFAIAGGVRFVKFCFRSSAYED